MAENTGAKMADAGNKNGEGELTMCDVLAEENELEEDANAVLGDCDDTNCTYIIGYVPRQALYACATCTTSDVEPGGMCLACSYACHEGHELVELYTKRHFRCDCGNKRFLNNPCRLCPRKDDFNSDNGYNQNFKGVYCQCSRPYPDHEDEIADEMIQCVFCEDWHHGRHLGAKVPDNEDYGEMICSACIQAHPFLYSYKTKFEKEQIVSVVDEPKVEEKPVKTEDFQNGKISCGETTQVKEETTSTQNNVKTEASSDINKTIKSEHDQVAHLKMPVCFYKEIKTEKLELGPGFFPEGWRSELCVCADCKTMYEHNKCSFLIDPNDTIKAYEERGKSRNGNQTQYDKGMSALSKMDRVKQMEAIRGYKNMKDKLKDYLKTFADENRTVEAKDIHDFFEGMQQSKRRRTDVPFFCR